MPDPRPTSASPGLLPRWRDDDVAPTLLFVAFSSVATCMPPHNDTWWLLHSGREMWQTRTLLLTERFSHTASGAPLYNHEWLTQIIFYALFNVGGPFLLTMFCAACVLGAVFGAWRLMRGSADLRLGLLAAVMVGATSEWAIRPQAMSLALLMVSVHLAVRGRTAWLPLVCLLWSNAHGMVLFGIVVAGCAAVESVVWSRRRAVRDGCAAALCIVAPMLTPIGWHYWPRVLDTVTMSRTLGIQEYRTAFELAQLPFWVAIGVLLVAAVRSRAWLQPDRRGDRVLLLVSAVLAVAGILSVRNIPFFLLVAAPALSRVLAATVTVRTRVASSAAVAMAAAALVISIGAVAYRWRDGGAALGWKPMTPAAANAIAACPGPLFNGFADGGPILWFVPGRRVLVDSRVEAYPLDLLRRSREADLNGRYEDLFRQYAITCAAVGTDSMMARRLSVDPRMSRRFADGRWTIFAHLQ